MGTTEILINSKQIMSASISETIAAINSACREKGGIYQEYSCQTVSWDDVQRGTVGDSLSCWGSNITDTYLKSKDGRQLYTVRSDNWNEKLGVVDSKDVTLISGNQFPGAKPEDLKNITLEDFLKNIENYGRYSGIDVSSLQNEDLDRKCSIRFQTTFLPIEEDEENLENNDSKKLGKIEFSTEAYNYNTTSDSDPRNLVLLASSQGIALQQDGAGSKKIFHHAVSDDGEIKRDWLEAERSRHKVGGEQIETKEEKEDALKRGKAVSNFVGIEALGSRFNVLLTVQIPLKQKEELMERCEMQACYFGDSDSCESLMMEQPVMKSYAYAPKMMMELCAKSYSCEPEIAMACDDTIYFTENEAISDEFLDFVEEEEEIAPQTSTAIEESSVKKRRTSIRRIPKTGTANAARVSRGTEVDTWNGLSVETPVRNDDEHLTISVVIYFTVVGGVPSKDDVIAAIDDMEMLYNSCKSRGNLADEKFDFMKKELTVEDTEKIKKKMVSQPVNSKKTEKKNKCLIM